MKSFYSLVFYFALSIPLFAQNEEPAEYFQHFEENASLLNSFKAENFLNTFKVPSFKDDLITLEYKPAVQQENTVKFIRTMLGIGAGLGFTEDETLWCLGASYFYRLKLMQRSALYGSLGLMYNGLSNDLFNQNLIDVQLQLLMFQSIRNLTEIQLVYGILGAYGFGSEKYDGFKSDLSRVTVAAVLGVYLAISSTWSLLLQTNVFTYQSLTAKPQSGGKFKTDYTGFFLNKASLFSLTVLIHLTNSKQRS